MDRLISGDTAFMYHWAGQIYDSKKGFPPGELQLKFNGQLLEDRHMLSDYSIQTGAVVTCNHSAGEIDAQILFSLLAQILRSQPSKLLSMHGHVLGTRPLFSAAYPVPTSWPCSSIFELEIHVCKL